MASSDGPSKHAGDPPSGEGAPDPFAKFAVERTSTAQLVAASLREMILTGVLAPGRPLREPEIGASLGVSRNTLREALRILGQQGLVTHNAHRGVAVRVLTTQDVRDIFGARVTLELRGAELCGEAPAERIDALESSWRAREHAVDEHQWQVAFDADMEFHAVLVSLIGSPRLDRFFLGLLSELRLAYHMLEGFETEGLLRDREQHAEILACVRAGDAVKARRAVRGHLRDAEALLLELLERSYAPA